MKIKNWIELCLWQNFQKIFRTLPWLSTRDLDCHGHLKDQTTYFQKKSWKIQKPNKSHLIQN